MGHTRNIYPCNLSFNVCKQAVQEKFSNVVDIRFPPANLLYADSSLPITSASDNTCAHPEYQIMSASAEVRVVVDAYSWCLGINSLVDHPCIFVISHETRPAFAAITSDYTKRRFLIPVSANEHQVVHPCSGDFR